VSLASLCVSVALKLLEDCSIELLERVSELLDGASLELLFWISALLAMLFTELFVVFSAELLDGVSFPLLYGMMGEFSLSPPQLAQNRVVAENKIFFQYLRMFMHPPNNGLRNTSKIYFFLKVKKNFLFPLQFQHIIGCIYKVLRMFYGYDGVACVAKPVNEAEQLLDVLLVETTGGFVKEE